MNRKIVMTVLCSAVLLVLCIFAVKIYGRQDLIKERSAAADEQIEKMIRSQTYLQASPPERAGMVLPLMKELKAKRLIKSFFYDESEQLITYCCLDGSLGGVKLEDFASSDENFVP